MAAKYQRESRNLGAGTSAGGCQPIAVSLPQLPDELVVEILSRLGTLNEAARCSSLVCKRWRNLWRSIRGGVLDFDESHDVRRRMMITNRGVVRHNNIIIYEEKRRFVNRVNQAITNCLPHQNLDALKLGSDFYGVDQKDVRSWIEFGLTKRVKELTLSTVDKHYDPLPLCFFTPESLTKHDLSRLEVLKFRGLSRLCQGAVDHILSNCPSLRRFVLRSCFFQRVDYREVVIRVSSSNNLEYLFLDEVDNVDRIELVSAPRLHTFKLRGKFHYSVVVEIGDDDLPQLRETLLCAKGGGLLPWYPSQFSEFAARIERLGLVVVDRDFFPCGAPPRPGPEWLLSEKLRVLDLFMYMDFAPRSFLECAVLLRAAPMLRELSVWFKHIHDARRWERPADSSAESSSTWKHPSLEVLRLHGVHPIRRTDEVNVRNKQLELAVYIIMNAPSLSQVVIDTRYRNSLDDDVFGEIRFSDSIDAHMYGAKMELESQLRGRRASPHINFTYQ